MDVRRMSIANRRGYAAVRREHQDARRRDRPSDCVARRHPGDSYPDPRISPYDEPAQTGGLAYGTTNRRQEMADPTGKRVAVLVEKFYEDLELWYPVLRLREAGCQV